MSIGLTASPRTNGQWNLFGENQKPWGPYCHYSIKKSQINRCPLVVFSHMEIVHLDSSNGYNTSLLNRGPQDPTTKNTLNNNNNKILKSPPFWTINSQPRLYCKSRHSPSISSFSGQLSLNFYIYPVRR